MERPAVTATKAPRRVRAGLISLSLALAAIVPLANDTPYGDLSRWYTDHLHHSEATWVFFHRPVAIYRDPFGVARRGIAYPHAAALWDDMPMTYPPGVFAVFAPLALVGEFVPMSRHAFGVLGVLYMIVLAHAALFALWLALDALDPGARLVVGIVGWMLLLRLGLQGFFDSAWIGCAAMMVRSMARQRPVTALRWSAAAALLHFRAVTIVPLVLAALADCVRDKRVREWPLATFALLAAVAVLSIVTFVLMFPATAGFRAHAHNLVQASNGRLVIVMVASAIAALLAARWSDGVVAGVVVIGALLAVIDFQPWWWHGTLLLFAPLAVGAWKKASEPALARGLLVGWLLCVQPLAFNGSPGDVFVEIADHFRFRKDLFLQTPRRAAGFNRTVPHEILP